DREAARPQARLGHGRGGCGQVARQRVERALRLGRVRLFDSLRELVERQPPLPRRVPQPRDGLLALCVCPAYEGLAHRGLAYVGSFRHGKRRSPKPTETARQTSRALSAMTLATKRRVTRSGPWARKDRGPWYQAARARRSSPSNSRKSSRR